MIDANSAGVWIAAIGGLTSVFVAIIGLFKLVQIHTLTNSGMSEVKGQLATALGRIDELNKAAVMARVPMMPPLPGTLPPPAPDPVPSARPVPSLVRPTDVPADIMAAATLTGIAAAATSVADAAVDKRDEIVGKK